MKLGFTWKCPTILLISVFLATHAHAQQTVAALKAQDKAVLAQNVGNTIYRGPIKQPEFSGRDRKHAGYSTRIKLGIKDGPNFASRYRIIVIGCGAGCRFAKIGDVSTGRVFDFPLGGEDNMYLDLHYNLKSSALIAYWQNIEKDQCIREEFLLKGTHLQQTKTTTVGARELCDELFADD